MIESTFPLLLAIHHISSPLPESMKNLPSCRPQDKYERKPFILKCKRKTNFDAFKKYGMEFPKAKLVDILLPSCNELSRAKSF